MKNIEIMKREIKFRGQRVDTKEWVYGTPYFLNIEEDEPEDCVNKVCIITGVDWDGTCGFMSPDNDCFVEVIPESVGQFTGLKDRDGKGVEVYEGDKIGRTSFFDKLVIWDKCGFYTISVNNPERKFPLTHLDEFDIVIGNIHNNPDLLK